MKKLLLKLLFRKQYEYNFYFKDGDKKKYFNVYSPYELSVDEQTDFARTINSIVYTKIPIFDHTIIEKMDYLVKYKADPVKREELSKIFGVPDVPVKKSVDLASVMGYEKNLNDSFKNLNQ